MIWSLIYVVINNDYYNSSSTDLISLPNSYQEGIETNGLLNGKTINQPSDLVDIFKDVDEDAEVKISILRAGEKKSFTAKLKPFEGHSYAFHVDDQDGDVLIDILRSPGHDKDINIIRSSGINATTGGKGGYLGVQVKDLSDQLQKYFEVKNGVLIFILINLVKLI